MTLKENSKANYISSALLGLAALNSIIIFITGIINCFKHSMIQFAIPNVFLLLPIIVLIYTSVFLLKVANRDFMKTLVLYGLYFISVPVCMILSSLIRIVLFGEAIALIQILFTIIEVILLFLPVVIGINIAKSEENISMLKIVAVIEMVIFAILSALAIQRCLYGGTNVINGLSAFSVLLTYVSIFILSKDLICIKKDDIAPTKPIKENIAKNVIFSILTFGIYGWFWLYRMSREIKQLNNDKSSCTGEILCLLFIPFYILYWIYTREKKIVMLSNANNQQISDNSALYLIISLLGLILVSIALMQNDLNNLIDTYTIIDDIPLNDAKTYTKNNDSDIIKLEQLSELFKKGILSEDEYQEKKKELLDRI